MNQLLREGGHYVEHNGLEEEKYIDSHDKASSYVTINYIIRFGPVCD